MKKYLITLAAFSALISSTAIAQESVQQHARTVSERVANSMIRQFDTDNSQALNKLELSEAIAYLDQSRPLLIHRLDYTSLHAIPSAPPRIAVGLMDGFDSNEDFQLSEKELSLALTYLRRLDIDTDTLLAVSE